MAALPASWTASAKAAAREDLPELTADADAEFDFDHMRSSMTLQELGARGAALHARAFEASEVGTLPGDWDEIETQLTRVYVDELERRITSGAPRAAGVGETLDNASIQLEGAGAGPGLGATRWVDKLLNEHWDGIVAATPEGAVPVSETVSKRGKISGSELGCGHYGCVIETADENVVMKITSDETEAFFVACALSIGDIPAGMVNYLSLRAFPEEGTSHKGRKTFVLWREAAHDIGYADRHYKNTHWGYDATEQYDKQNLAEIYRLVSSFKDSAGGVREILKRSKDDEKLRADALELEDWAWDWGAENWDDFFSSKASMPFAAITRGLSAPRRFAAALRFCRIGIEVMQNTFRADMLGDTLDFYLEHGLLLCDVHANNIGRVHRAEDSDGGEEPLVITDPGHALALDDRWAEVTIEEL